MKFYFKNLDSLRTLAFLSTFLAHAFYTKSDEVSNSDSFQLITGLQEYFGFGVPVFFVLSGFLITYLMFREKAINDKFYLWKFYARRVLRIWPVYYVVITFGFVIFPIVRTSILGEPYNETADPLMYYLFLSNFDQISTGELPFGAGLGPTWSVSVEEQFYLFWPLLFIVFIQKRFLFVIASIIIISFCLSSTLGLSSKNTIFCLTYLSVGALYAYFAYFKEKFIKRITAVHPIIFILSVFLLCYFVYLISYTSIGYLFVLLAALVIGYIIVYQCYSSRFELRKIPFLERLGKYTYGLYLYHVICNFIVYSIFSKILNFEESSIHALITRPLMSLILSIIISVISYRYMETFFLRLKGKFKPDNQ